jgi:uncharacterized protein (TIGR04255 family)
VCPYYLRPPVTEVVIGAQFRPLDALVTAHIGLYWNTIRNKFPGVEEHGPVDHIIERQGGDLPPPPPGLTLLSKPELPRTWFIDRAGTHLIQVQRDRFIYNWRKQKPSDTYDRFTPIKRQFLGYWNTFRTFLNSQHLQTPTIDQCELTYVNQIDSGAGWNSMADWGQLFINCGWNPKSGFLKTPEAVRWAMHFVLPNQAGRLRVEAIPAVIPPEGKLTIRFSLTARGAPSGADTAATSRWYEVAHESIVRGFADIVTEKADKLWQRQR